MYILLQKLFTICFILLSTLSLFAKEQLLQEEQRKRFEEQQSLKKESLKRVHPLTKLKLAKKENEPCITIEKITFGKSELLSTVQQHKFVKNYINRCNSLTEINNLAKKVSNYFISKGYSTSRAYIKPQKLTDKSLHISILEGKIDQFNIQTLHTNLLFGEMENSILNIRDLEVGIEQIERLKSQKASIQLKPSKKVEHSDVYIIGEQTDKFYNGNISMNNYGTKTNGRLQYSAVLNLENLLNINDNLSISLNNSQENNNKNDNNGQAISFAFPMERFFIKTSYSKFQYNQTIHNNFDTYSTKGVSQEYKTDLNYKAYHNHNHKVAFDTGIKVKDNDNKINNISWESSSYRYSSGYLSLNHTFSTNLFQMYTIWKYTKGLNAFDIDNPTELNHDFEKYNFDLNLTKYFQGDLNLRLSSLFSSQYSTDRLFSAEQFSVGGAYSVRGFNNNGLSGNSGYYIRNDLGFHQESDWLTYSPYIGIDYGFIKKSSDASYGEITGGVIGSRFEKSFASLDVYYSFPINDAEFTKDKSQDFVGFNLTLSF